MTAGQLKLPLVYLASTGAGRSSGAQHSDAPYPGVMNLGGIKVVIPSTPADAKGLMKASIREDNPVLLLLPTRRGGEQGEVPDGDHVVPLGKGSVKREGRDVTVVAIGVMVRHAMRAAATLFEEGIEVEVVDPLTLFPLDKELTLASVRTTGPLLTHEAAPFGKASCRA